MPDGIMRQGRTDCLENGATDVDDLLIGDQLLFATNPALIALGRVRGTRSHRAGHRR